MWNPSKDLTKTWDLKEGETMAEADYEKLRELISINPMDIPEPPANIMEYGMRLLQE